MISQAFEPIFLAGATLKNRFIKAATYEGMTPTGKPSDDLIDFHTRIARGGAAMTTVAYGAVHPDGRTHEDQLRVEAASLPQLRELTTSVRSEGGLSSIQLTHCGYFTRNRKLSVSKPLSASVNFNAYGFMSGLPLSRSMNQVEICDVVSQFAHAAEISLQAGFDAIELHMGHGYLLSQFLSPATNKRNDEYGGNTSARTNFPVQVIQAVRNVVGDDFPILAKINLEDGFRGGLAIDESVEIARILEHEGVNALVLSGSFTSKTPFYLMRGKVPRTGMIRVEKNLFQKAAIALFGQFIMRPYPFKENYFLPLALTMRQGVSIPLVYAGGVVSSSGVSTLMQSGFELMAVGRALIEDPDFVRKVQSDTAFTSPCNHCNECMVQMDIGGVRCVLK